MSRIRQGLSLLLVAVALSASGPGLTAHAAVPEPPASWPCESYPTSLVKSGGYVTGTMRLQCERTMILMQVWLAMERKGGGADHKSFYSNGKQCTQTKVCTATFKVKDVAGTQTYWFINVPYRGGTMVSQGLDYSDQYCNTNYINCTSVIRKF